MGLRVMEGTGLALLAQQEHNLSFPALCLSPSHGGQIHPMGSIPCLAHRAPQWTNFLPDGMMPTVELGATEDCSIR